MADETPVFNFVNPPGSGAIIRNDQGDAGGGGTRDVVDFEQSGTEVFSIDSNGLPDPGGGDPKRQVVCCIGDIVADSDAIEHYLCEFQAAVTITAMKVAVNADTADGSTNKQLITVAQSGGDGTVCSYITAATNPGLADETWASMSTPSNAGQDAGEYLYVTYTKTSSGLIMNGLTILVEYTLAG